MKPISKIRNDCYILIDKIVKNGEISKENLLIALSFRLNIPLEMCKISKFDEENCKKCLKMLQKML